MKRKLIISGLLLAAMTAGAVKMKPGVASVVQSDGTTLSVMAYGDEDLNYYVTMDGTLLFLKGTDYYVAHVSTDGTSSPTTQLAHEPALRSNRERMLVTMQRRQLFYDTMQQQASANRLRREPMQPHATYLPHLGSPRVPVILVEFSDTVFTVDNPKETFDKYLNAKELFNRKTEPVVGRNYGSVARYFSDMSGGKFTPQFDVYGPVKLPHPLKHYGAGPSSSERMDSLFYDACTAVDADVDFSQYDSNQDGNIDLVYIIYAGYSESVLGNSSDCIHPKSGTITLNKTFDGMNVKRIGVNNELNGTPADQTKNLYINGIGLFCHEFAHCMGLPDMYPASGTQAERLVNQNMEYWDLMDAGEYTNNGYHPTELTAWERERLEWMQIDTLDAAADVELAPLSAGGKAYRVLNDKDDTGHEYYILENVQQTGWNKKMLGHGLMVSHVDYSDSQFQLGGCKVNGDAGHPRMSLMAADGMLVPGYFMDRDIPTESQVAVEQQQNAPFYAKYGGRGVFTAAMYREEAAGDLYPGSTGATSLTDTSAPMAAWTYTGGLMGKPITDITETAETGHVTFKFMGGSSASGVQDISGKSQKTPGLIYSLDGTCLGSDVSRLGKGVYIRDGKKFVKI